MSNLLDAYAEQHVTDFLARDAHKNLVPERSPPGYPLGYVRERIEITCSCGAVSRLSRILVVEKSSTKSRKIRPAGKGEVFYNLECAEVNSRGGTNACDACFATRKREYVPELPDYKRKIGHSQPKDEKLDFDDFKDLEV